MRYIVGMDGGGTKTDCYVFREDGVLAAAVSGGATNHEAYGGGFDEMTPVFDRLLQDALSAAGITCCDVASAVFGMAGIDVPAQKDRMEQYLDRFGFADRLVMNDSFLGIKAACPGGCGISFVNGTGNSVGGIDLDGKWLQVGGTGEYFGDLNGARGMSGAVVRAVYSMYYRCGDETDMAPRFFTLLGITKPEAFTEAVYTQYFSGQVTNADIHNQVLYPAAENNDPVARGLLVSFGEQFADSIGGCIRNLRFGGSVDLVLIGSATLKARSPLMMDTCVARVEALTGKQIRTIPLDVPPAAGAVLWGIERASSPARAQALREAVVSALKK